MAGGSRLRPGPQHLGAELDQLLADHALHGQWILADLGILGAGGITVTIYQSNLPHECQYILEDSGATLVFCDTQVQAAKINEVKGKLPALQRVICAAACQVAVGVGADYAIYLIYRLREELAREVDEATAVHDALTTAGKAILFVALAVAGGYGVLMLSYQFYPHVWLAILIVSAMLVSSLSALTVLPAIVLTIRPRCVFDVHRRL